MIRVCRYGPSVTVTTPPETHTTALMDGSANT